jgi:Nucleoside 2-deoxyribosyltransferase
VTTQVKQISSFVSAPAGTDISQLLEILKENHIKILDPAQFAPGAVKITDKIIDGIRHADLVIAVLGAANLSGNVLFELGCASALGKKVLIIIPEGSEIPSDIKDFVYIRTISSNREAVNFALDQILNAPDQDTKTISQLLDKSKPLGSLADDLLDRLQDSSKAVSEKNVEDVVREMLETSGIQTRISQRYSGVRPDFVVWIDELEPYLGNPILIEIKGFINTSSQAKSVIDQVLHYMTICNVTNVIIFATHLSSEAMGFVSSFPNLYFFDICEFLKQLRQESLGQVIRKERNARFHGRIG